MSLNKSKVLRTAEKYVLQGKLPAAIDEYRKVVDADPSDLTTINTLGDLYVRAGKIQDAITNFSRIADSYREGGFTLKAIAMLKKISKLDPTNVETAMKLANLYSQQGLLVEARQQYLQVADAYARQGQTRKALDAYQKIADLDPSNTSVRMKLGEIYSREGLTEQAHESFLVAGSEFLRKNDMEQALNANLKAISINPDSRQALTAIATIYTQQGQTDRAVNLLCDAFERNPGDVELLTILGRTYLSAGMMDDAERTFLSLVELDRNRYHYLLEVGRRFLQIGDLDRAAEQIDGCLDVLIGKREEDKAIDFLRKVLDRDMNHIGALKRLAQIFLRIREDHNLIATLNSLVEAAMRKGTDDDAIAALKELTRLEPDEPMHLQRLYNLGIKDIVESDSPDVIRATGPLDYQSAAFDDAFVIRQISEAEILAGHGQVTHAVEILTGILTHAPENVQVHLKLKDIYLRAGIMDKSAEQCLELARIHEARGESARASDYMAEARQLNPLMETSSAELVPQEPASWAATGADPFAYQPDFAIASPEASSNGADATPDTAEPMDWSRYQTGAFGDAAKLVGIVGESGASNGANGASSHPPAAGNADEFRYSDTLIGKSNRAPQAASPMADLVFSATGNLPSDTMSRVLRDELEGIDFYIAQGYLEIAHDTLDRLRTEYGDHPEVLARYKRLGLSVGEATVSEPELQPELASEPELQSEPEPAAAAPVAPPVVAPEPSAAPAGTVFFPSLPTEASEPAASAAAESAFDVVFTTAASADEPPAESLAAAELRETLATLQSGENHKVLPFLVNKESGPLYPDLMVQLNTKELLHDTLFEAMPPPEAEPATAEDAAGTQDLLDSIVSNIDSSFDNIQMQAAEPPAAVAPMAVEPLPETEIREASAPVVEPPAPEAEPAVGLAASETFEVIAPAENSSALYDTLSWSLDTFADDDAAGALHDIFEDLKSNTGTLTPMKDFETHYSLGLAYKDMDLLDDAIAEFQRAFRLAGGEDQNGDDIQCCNLLGVCFGKKALPKVAIMWFERGLKITNRSEDEYQALRYEMGMCYQTLGDLDKALDIFMEVYGTDVNYRAVGEKIRQLQAAKPA